MQPNVVDAFFQGGEMFLRSLEFGIHIVRPLFMRGTQSQIKPKQWPLPRSQEHYAPPVQGRIRHKRCPLRATPIYSVSTLSWLRSALKRLPSFALDSCSLVTSLPGIKRKTIRLSLEQAPSGIHSSNLASNDVLVLERSTFAHLRACGKCFPALDFSQLFKIPEKAATQRDVNTQPAMM
jgi:hypothetical protein